MTICSDFPWLRSNNVASLATDLPQVNDDDLLVAGQCDAGILSLSDAHTDDVLIAEFRTIDGTKVEPDEMIGLIDRMARKTSRTGGHDKGVSWRQCRTDLEAIEITGKPFKSIRKCREYLGQLHGKAPSTSTVNRALRESETLKAWQNKKITCGDKSSGTGVADPKVYDQAILTDKDVEATLVGIKKGMQKQGPAGDAEEFDLAISKMNATERRSIVACYESNYGGADDDD